MERESPPTIPWDELLYEFLQSWKQGQHVALIGPTGMGKTTTGLQIVDARARYKGAHATIFATKTKDETLTKFAGPQNRRAFWRIIHSWDRGYGMEHIILWPQWNVRKKKESLQHQRTVFKEALDDMFAEGDQLIYVDEQFYMEDKLNLKDDLDFFYTQGRSQGLTMVVGNQRPFGISRQVFANVSWVFLFKTQDDEDLKRVGEIGGGSDMSVIREELRRLRKYEFLLVQRESGRMVRSMVQLPR